MTTSRGHPNRKGRHWSRCVARSLAWYRMPNKASRMASRASRLTEKALQGLGFFADHCSYFPVRGSITSALAADLMGYTTAKGSIQFPSDEPLPADLVARLIE